MASPSPPSVSEAPPTRPNLRLSMQFQHRMVLASSIAFISGLGLGASQGGNMAGLRFQAENAHRLPTSATGWYLYHKTKNYHVAKGSIKEGLKLAPKMAFWAGLFLWVEEAIDTMRRGNRDFMSTVVAGLGTSGAWSLWYRFPLITAARTARLGLKVGLGYGLLQDALRLAYGQKPGYVEFIRNIPQNLEESKQRKIAAARARARGEDQ